MELRTRYRIVFLYREMIGGKCVSTPLYYKLSGAVDGDAFAEYKELAQEIYDTIAQECIIPENSGVCVVLYQQKEPFEKQFFTSTPFIYKTRVTYVLTKTKNGVNRAYKIDKRGKKTPTNYKKAKKNDTAQKRRIRKAQQKHTISELERHKKFDNKQDGRKMTYKASKKKVLKQFQMYSGCYSTDMAYKGS